VCKLLHRCARSSSRAVIWHADGSALHAEQILYPFNWQHIFIPVVPQSLLSFCCAPMPFLIGVLRVHLNELKKLSDDMEEVAICFSLHPLFSLPLLSASRPPYHPLNRWWWWTWTTIKCSSRRKWTISSWSHLLYLPRSCRAFSTSRRR